MALRSTYGIFLCTGALAAAALMACGDDDSTGGGGSGGDPTTTSSTADTTTTTTTSASTTTSGTGGSGPGTVYDVAANNADFSILKAAVDKAGLASALQNPSATLTVFAPNNAAFGELLTEIGATGLDDLSAEQLRPILLYHVLGTEIGSAAATTAATAGDKVDALGGKIQLGLDGSDIELDDRAKITDVDIDASNGVIHVIDKVILPSITDVATTDSRFTSLTAALIKADEDASNPGLVAALDNDAGSFTVFAPPDTAFTALVTALSANANTGIANLGSFQSYQLIPVLKYHVVAGAKVRAADVSAGPIDTLGGKVVADTTSGVEIDGAEVVIADILTSNGVIHVVESVLLPSITDVVTTAPEFDGLKTAVLAADGATGTDPKVAAALDAPAATGAYTLFAPNNAAFTALGTGAPSGQDLTNVLLYHVLNQSTAIYAAQALALTSPTPFNTLLGTGASQQIIISASGGSVVLDDAGSMTNGNVTVANYFTANGVIHIVNKVLLPGN